MSKPVRVVIVDDHLMVRLGLKLCLKGYPEISVVGEAENGCSALDIIASMQPDVVLMDLVMPECDGVDAIRLIERRFPQTKVLALTSFLEDHRVTEVMAAGAAGYLLKDIEPRDLVNAIRAVSRGEVALHPHAARVLVQEWREGTAPASDVGVPSAPAEPPILTARQMEVMEQLAQGKSNQAIADELSITVKTVKAHISSILARLGVENRVQAIVRARELGLLSD